MSPLFLFKLLRLRSTLAGHLRWSRARIKEHQSQELRRLREFAYRHSPFYQNFHKGLFDNPLEDLPILTKNGLMEHYDTVLTDSSLKLSDLESYLNQKNPDPLFKNRYRVNATSGSTGIRGIFPYDPKEWLAILASYSRAYDLAGVAVGLTHRLRMAVVSTTTSWHQSAAVGSSVRSFLVPTLRIDAKDEMSSIVERLNHFMPQSLVAYAGMARQLAIQAIEGQLRIHPAAVFCASEPLTEDSRELCRRAWGIDPFNVYGATETAGIASETLDRNGLLVYEDLLLTECVDDQYRPVEHGEFGSRLLVTVFFSRTLPLIRYEITDSVRFSRSPSAKDPFARIGTIQGRSEDTLILKTENGERVLEPYVFHEIMEAAPVAGWQISQTSPGGVVIRVVKPAENFSEEGLIARVRSALAGKGVESFTIQIQKVDSLNKGKLGKTPLIQALKNVIFEPASKPK